jgi:hypothetical protein
MKLFSKAKDGGPKSPVDAYFFIECKSLFSVALLKFNKGAREQYHNHAFDALTWFLKGSMTEETYDGMFKPYKRSLVPKYTKKTNMHRVVANEDSWCITLRGPWQATWQEADAGTDTKTTFTHGRAVIATTQL